MEVYMVAKTQSHCDSDGWQWWTQKCPLSYHSTKEGAISRISSLIEVELSVLMMNRDNNPSIEDEYWNKCASDIRNNVLLAPSGNNGRDIEECELFVITPLTIED